MTDLDTRLYAAWKIGDDFEKSQREIMTPQEEQAEEQFIRLLKHPPLRIVDPVECLCSPGTLSKRPNRNGG